MLSFLVLPVVQMTRLPMADGSVHRMVYRFGKVFLENECTILGAIDGPECDSFNRSGRSPLITYLVNLQRKSDTH